MMTKGEMALVFLGTFRTLNENPLATVVDRQVVVHFVAQQRIGTSVLFVAALKRLGVRAEKRLVV